MCFETKQFGSTSFPVTPKQNYDRSFISCTTFRSLLALASSNSFIILVYCGGAWRRLATRAVGLLPRVARRFNSHDTSASRQLAQICETHDRSPTLFTTFLRLLSPCPRLSLLPMSLKCPCFPCIICK